MPDDFSQILRTIIETQGIDAFENYTRTNALLLDMAPGKDRERFLARTFTESGAFHMLRDISADYPLTFTKIIKQLTENFCIRQDAAIWVTRAFSSAMGYTKDNSENLPLVLPPLQDSDQNTDFGSAVISAGWNNNLAPVAMGVSHAAAVLTDGTIVAGGRNDYLQCDFGGAAAPNGLAVSNPSSNGLWNNIISVAVGDAHTVGLRIDGTVVAAGRNNYDQCDVGHLKDIAAVYAFGDYTICINRDGKVYDTGKSNINLEHFEDIRAIAKHPEGVYGIRRDGTVALGGVTARDNPEIDWEESEWARSLENVVQIISTYIMGSIVLKTDGGVYKMGEPDNYFATLRDIKSIVDLNDGFAVLRADGTVRVLPYDRNAPRILTEADYWRDISAIFGRYKRLAGLTSQGHLLYTCTDQDWQKRKGSLEFITRWYPVGSMAAVNNIDFTGVNRG